MANKRRIIYDDDDDDEDEDGDAADGRDDGSFSKRTRRASEQTDTQPEVVATEQATSSGKRRSVRSGKGSGGRVAQLRTFEQKQTDQAKRLSRVDIATQGEQLNPMAPSSQQDTASHERHSRHGQDSDSLDTVLSQRLAAGSSQNPAFLLAAPGERFGFRSPGFQAAGAATPRPSIVPRDEISTRAPSRTRFRPMVSEASSRSVSSRSNSVTFSGGPSQRGGTSTPPTSRAPSVCSTGKRVQPHIIQRPNGAGSRNFDERRNGSHNPSLTALGRTASVNRLPLHLDKTARGFTAAPSVLRDGGEVEIDEHSPSEDERVAEEFLRQRSPSSRNIESTRPSYELPVDDVDDDPMRSRTRKPVQTQLFASNDSAPLSSRSSSARPVAVTQATEDIVTAHRQRNRAPRLPSNSQLLAARQRQVSAAADDQDIPPQVATRSQEVPSFANIESNEADASKPVGPATEGAEPWQLQFYSPSARDIIERAKQFSHSDAASINAFPMRPAFNIKAVEYVNEAIAERRECCLHVSDGWWPHHVSGISRLLWEDLGNWRSTLRKKARTYVAQRYDWDSENRRDANIEIAKRLLDNGGLFLKDGVDEEGRVNNLAHPALAGVIIDFFYTGSTSVGQLFPEVFATEVPRVAVALGATALKVVLDEMIAGTGEVNFRVTTYSPVYCEILGLMNKCDTSPVHGAKTRALRVRWAELGSNGMTKQEMGGSATGFDVDLS